MNQRQRLVEFCRESRRGTPPAGNILDRGTLLEVLGMLLAAHLERTAPEGEPERVVAGNNGYYTVPAKAPPAWSPEMADETAKELATLIGYVEES